MPSKLESGHTVKVILPGVDCEVATEQAAQKLKNRLTGIAIDCSIHADFLNSFTQTYQQNSLLPTIQASAPTDVTSVPTVQ